MAEQFNYTSVLAPYMKHLLEIKSSAGISAHRMKWILKEFDDFANGEKLADVHVTEAFIQGWRATRNADCDRTLYAKYSVWSQLTRTMSRCGCECFIPRLPKQPKSGFTPYIFTPEQMTDIFNAADDSRLYGYPHGYCDHIHPRHPAPALRHRHEGVRGLVYKEQGRAFG